MGELRESIEAFLEKQSRVYAADPLRIERDTRAANKETRNHVGRWFFELFQNCDDAHASQVIVIVTDSAIYVGDDGDGFNPKSVASVSGTDYSDKQEGIGRKGIGFKSVYTVTENPQVYTTDSEGLEFNTEKSLEWLRSRNLSCQQPPYQWLPFFKSRTEEEERDPVLSELSNFRTVVKLPSRLDSCHSSVVKYLDWKAFSIIPFNNVRKLTVDARVSDLDSYTISIYRDSQGCRISDSRNERDSIWEVMERLEVPPDEVLQEIDAEERARITREPLKFLIAAPLNEEGIVEPLKIEPADASFPLYVFYPTEDTSPVRVLLHAEFSVKSDRTRIVSVENNRFNRWVANRLAELLCEFVQSQYSDKSPSAYLRLLNPLSSVEHDPCARFLWSRIVERAEKCLLLPNCNVELVLSLSKAKYILTSVSPQYARQILEQRDEQRILIHPSFDSDKNALEAIKKLGCKSLADNDVLNAIEHAPSAMGKNQDWVWACWEWLASWFAGRRYGDEHTARLERILSLPIIPSEGELDNAKHLTETTIISWKDEAFLTDPPSWMPIKFVDDWFRDRVKPLLNEQDTSHLASMVKEMKFLSRGQSDVLGKAVALAIEQYWKDTSSVERPEIFLQYLLTQDWHEKGSAQKSLTHCPVPSRVDDKDVFCKAKDVHFSDEWDNHLLPQIFEGVKGVRWVRSIPDVDKDRARRVLKWLGCADYVRVRTRSDINVSELPTEAGGWRNTFPSISCGRNHQVVVHSLEHDIEPAALCPDKICALIRIVVHKWKYYYRDLSHSEHSWFYYSSQSERVSALWFFQLKSAKVQCQLNNKEYATPLDKSWLPDSSTKKTIGSLISCVDTERFADDKTEVIQWLRDEIKVRTSIDQISVDEWRSILSENIPKMVPAETCCEQSESNKVYKWYRAALEALNNLSFKSPVGSTSLSDAPVLCQKGNEWKYVRASEETRYLSDNEEFKDAFKGELWLLHVSKSLSKSCEEFLSVKILSEEVKCSVSFGQQFSEQSESLRRMAKSIYPYVFASLAINEKERDRVLKKLRGGIQIEVVDSLVWHLELRGPLKKQIERKWAYDGEESTIFILKEHSEAPEPLIAKGLADALDAKSHSDFFQNLLRCKDDKQRRDSLLDRGTITSEVLDQLLSEFGDAEEQDPEEEISDTGREEPHEATSSVEEQTSASSGAEKTTEWKLKEVEETGVEMQTASNLGEPPAPGTDKEQSSSKSLSEETKVTIEKRGREFAKKKAEELGYQVEVMAPENPGFDLKAIKDSKELRIEVKAHLGTAGVVQLTRREYKEFIESKMGKFRWELWNVCNLSTAQGKPCAVDLSRYQDVPEEALDDKVFDLNLRKCKPVGSETS